MRNITLSAQEDAIKKARTAAARKHRTLNDLFREWLDSIGDENSEDKDIVKQLNSLWEEYSYLRVGRKTTRDEMNER